MDADSQADGGRGVRLSWALPRDAVRDEPALLPKIWYGMPAYAMNGDLICFFQSGHKFKTRYATIGFSDKAHLDEGTLWPVAFALKQLTAADEVRVAALVKQAVS